MPDPVILLTVCLFTPTEVRRRLKFAIETTKLDNLGLRDHSAVSPFPSMTRCGKLNSMEAPTGSSERDLNLTGPRLILVSLYYTGKCPEDAW